MCKAKTENIKQAKGNECSQYKSAAAIFSSSLPICPIYIFPSDAQSCFALVTSYNTTRFALVTSHNMPSNMLHTQTCIIWTQNIPRQLEKVKTNRANGQTGGKDCSSTFVVTAFISFGLINIFWQKP